MANNFIPKSANILVDDPEDVFSVPLQHEYNTRQCPGCGAVMFGVRDAICPCCGFKDPHYRD